MQVANTYNDKGLIATDKKANTGLLHSKCSQRVWSHRQLCQKSVLPVFYSTTACV